MIQRMEKPIWVEGRIWHDASGLVLKAVIVPVRVDRDGKIVYNSHMWEVVYE